MNARSAVDTRPVSLLLRHLFDGSEPAADWNGLVAAAAHLRLAPLLFRRLKQGSARDRVPAGAWERLRLAYLDSAGRNTRFYRRLRPVLAGLRDTGIPVIVLKGAFLAEAVYGDAALRPMSDADLMVRKADLPRARAVLLAAGGASARPVDIKRHCRRNASLPTLFIRDLAVDLHWAIERPTGPFRVAAAGLWDRARPAAIAGVEVLALSPEDLLLHLCLHLSHRHGLAVPYVLCDVAETVHRFRGELDWPRFARRAREWGATRYTGLVLGLARDLLGAEVPGDVFEQLVPGGIEPRVLEVARETVLARSDYRPPGSLAGRRGAGSLGGLVRLVWKHVFLSRDAMAVKYPASRTARHLYRFYALRLRDGIRAGWLHARLQARLMVDNPRRGREDLLVRWLRTGRP
ncbi:MAG: nucleotidyltransferase family protein [bacterium]